MAGDVILEVRSLRGQGGDPVASSRIHAMPGSLRRLRRHPGGHVTQVEDTAYVVQKRGLRQRRKFGVISKQVVCKATQARMKSSKEEVWRGTRRQFQNHPEGLSLGDD